MKRIVFLVTVAFLALLPLHSQNPQQVFDRANQLYQQNQYAEAQAEYEKLLQNGFGSAEVEYNLGNACYKSGQLAKAILHYERARKLAPGDEDLRHNLRLANLMITDKIEAAPRFFLVEAWNSLKAILSMEGLAWFGYGCYTVCLGAIALMLLARTYTIRKVSFLAALIGGSLCAVLFTIFLVKQSDLHRSDTAIVMVVASTLKNAPDARSSDAFVLHAGVKIQILDRVGEWVKIRIADGNVAWIEQQAIEVI